MSPGQTVSSDISYRCAGLGTSSVRVIVRIVSSNTEASFSWSVECQEDPDPELVLRCENLSGCACWSYAGKTAGGDLGCSTDRAYLGKRRRRRKWRSFHINQSRDCCRSGLASQLRGKCGYDPLLFTPICLRSSHDESCSRLFKRITPITRIKRSFVVSCISLKNWANLDLTHDGY